MKFAGHETFHLRDGWLRNGLSIADDPGESGLLSPGGADAIGVGGNMIKSIRHWLNATMLTDGAKETSDGKVADITELAKVITKHDPYFQSDATWWALHINLVNNPDFAHAWHWFFNDFKSNRFEKAFCVESLKRSLEYDPSLRCPAQKTLEKDVSAILISYAQNIPRQDLNPEDTKDCPFLRLGLLSFSRESGFYVPNYGPKNLPPEMLGYSIAAVLFDAFDERLKRISLTVSEVAALRSGPGRALYMRPEDVYDFALNAEKVLGEEWVRVRGQAGSRMIEVKHVSKEDWLEKALSTEQSELKKWRQSVEKKLQAIG